MKKMLIRLLMCACAVAIAVAQAPDTLWTRTCGGSQTDVCYAMVQTFDGGYVLAGATQSSGAGNDDFWLVKIGANGDSLWSHTYGGSLPDICYDVAQTPDNGFVLAGLSQSFGQGSSDYWMVRTNAEGDSLWSRTFGGSGNDQCYSLSGTLDGGFLLSGFETSFGGGNEDVWIVKTDELGDSLWSRSYGGFDYDFVESAVQMPDSGYALACVTHSFGSGNEDIWLIRTDSNGDSLWSRTYGGSGNEHCRGILQATGGDFVLAGHSQSFAVAQGDFWLLKTDGSGDSLWSRSYGGSGDEYATSVQSTADGGFVLVGQTTSFGTVGQYNAWVVRTDDVGDSLWSRPLGSSGDDRAWDVEVLGRTFVVGGYTSSFGAGGPDFWAVKLNRENCTTPTPLPFSDNFDNSELDSCWFWIREDTSHWSLTERPGWMRIWTQPETDFANECCQKNKLLRTIQDQHFRISSHLSFDPSANFHTAHLIVQIDQDNYLRVGQSFDGEQQGLFQFETSGEVFTSYSSYNDTLVYLQIDVHDTIVSGYMSSDSSTWSYLGSTFLPWLDQAVTVGIATTQGLIPGDSAAADFDYFRVDPLPGTNVCGNVSGVWDSTGSPYYVTCDVTVPAGQTLEIQPGVKVLFTGHYKFKVNGNLQAIGTDQDSIIFARAFPTEDSKGWGIRFCDADPACSLAFCVVEQCRATPSNPSTGSGGGIYMTHSSPAFLSCTIRNNVADYDGGGVTCFENCSPRFANCLIDSNAATGDAGGILFHTDCNPVLTRCIISNNSADGSAGGGGVFNHQSTVALINCSIVGNSSSICAGGVEQRTSGSTSLINCAVWGNEAPNGPQLHVTAGEILATYSDVQGGYPGTGNIDEDPHFVDPENGDFHLTASSPCVDSGDPSSPLDPDSTTADMGAFYYPQPNLLVEPTSLDFGLLDLGTDTTMMISFYDPTVLSVVIDSIANLLAVFTIDTTGLGTQFGPQSTFEMPVTFFPTASGTYRDTVVIIADIVENDTIRIPMAGEAAVIPLPVDSLVIKKGPMNGIELSWAPVTETISGQPLNDVGYVIYGATRPTGEYVPFGFTASTTYSHPFILNTQHKYFYRVEPYIE